MEMGFEHDLWLQPITPQGLAAAQGGVRTLDWHALAARLAAAYAFVRDAGFGAVASTGGSFHPSAALRLAAYGQTAEDKANNALATHDQFLRFVNPVDKADRKHAGAKDNDVAGSQLSGDRGLI